MSHSSFNSEIGFYPLHPSFRTLSRLGIFARTTVTLASPSGGDIVPLPLHLDDFSRDAQEWTSSDAHDVDGCSLLGLLHQLGT